MDPQTVLDNILSLVRSGRADDDTHEEFAYLMADLFKWLNDGGFPPTLPSDMKSISTTSRHSGILGCYYAIDKTPNGWAFTRYSLGNKDPLTHEFNLFQRSNNLGE